VTFLNRLSRFCNERAPSDLLLQPGEAVHFFKDDGLAADPDLVFPPEAVSELLALAGLKEWPRDRHLTLVLDRHRLRTAFYTERGRPKATLRLLPKDIPSVATLRIPPAVVELATNQNSGLILVCGRQGTGKSTTLGALLQHISCEGLHQKDHFYTLEDPIEFQFTSRFPLQFTQRALHEDVASYATGLATAKRAKANVILVGEVKEPESALAAINAAIEGNLVFATLHTGKAYLSVEALLKLIPEHRYASVQAMLPSVLRCVLCQQLVPAQGGGQTAVHEVLIASPEVEAAIKSGHFRSIDSSLETSVRRGSQQFTLSLQRACEAGIISPKIRDEYSAYLRS
jgi:Tfp pilus assembly pilus retraction ATPase PilT